MKRAGKFEVSLHICLSVEPARLSPHRTHLVSIELWILTTLKWTMYATMEYRYDLKSLRIATHRSDGNYTATTSILEVVG